MSGQGNLSWGRRASRRTGPGHNGDNGGGSGGANNRENVGDNHPSDGHETSLPSSENRSQSRRVSERAVSNRREETRREESYHEESRRVEHTATSVHRARHGPNPEPADAMLTRLAELLLNAAGRQPRNSERVGTYTLSDFLKLATAMKNIGTTKFGGEPDPIKADEWMEMLESNLEATLCPAEYKKTIAVHYLEKEALAWWKNTERTLNETVVSWETFKTEFLRKYFPSEARDRLERKFLNLYQGSWTVRQYEAEFVKLRRYVYMGKDDEATMMRYFLNGLKPELSSRLSVVDFPNLNRMIERAANVEEKLNMVQKTGNKSGNAAASQSGKPKSEFNRYPSASGKGSTQSGNQSKAGSKSGTSGVCFNCGKPGHFAKDCTVKKTEAKTESRKRERAAPDHITCFACGEKGHYATSCPNRTMLSGPSVNRPRAESAKSEPATKKKNVDNHVYALNVEEPESSNAKKGPVAGM